MTLLTDYNSPGWLVAVLVGLSLFMAVIGLPLARRAGRVRAERLRHPENHTSRRDRAKDRALFMAALVPSILVWLSVMGVSFKGLTGFAADYMAWRDWTNTIVPLSLDGISVAFGAHAFRAVKRGRYPGRANKIVFAAAATSAVLNFVHAREAWSAWAGVYLAFMSIVGVAMFHEMLEQFSDTEVDERELRSRTPRFGKRWLLAPINTFVVWRMWIYDPPADRRPATVRNALDHYAEVRARRRQRSQELADLKVAERRAQLTRNAELAQARLAAQRAVKRSGDGAGQADAARIRGADPDPVRYGDGLAAPVPAVHVPDRAPVRSADVATVGADPVDLGDVLDRAPVPAPPSAGGRTTGNQGVSNRQLAARWAPRARRLAVERLGNGERFPGSTLRDLVEERVATEEGLSWRPSESWASGILREARKLLAQQAKATELERKALNRHESERSVAAPEQGAAELERGTREPVSVG